MDFVLASAGDFSSVLESGTTVLTWIISSLTSIVNWIASTPVVMIMFIFMIISFAVGMLFRIWRSTGV